MSKPVNRYQNDLFDFLGDNEGDIALPILDETIKLEEETHAKPIQTLPVSQGDTGQAQVGTATDHRDSEPVGAGLAGDGEGVDKVRSIFGSVDEPGEAGTGRIVTAGEQSSGKARDSAGIWPQPVPTRSKLEFVIDADDIGQGGLAKKYRDNITAIHVIRAMELEDSFPLKGGDDRTTAKKPAHDILGGHDQDEKNHGPKEGVQFPTEDQHTASHHNADHRQRKRHRLSDRISEAGQPRLIGK
jgi:hypothetical protein